MTGQGKRTQDRNSAQRVNSAVLHILRALGILSHSLGVRPGHPDTPALMKFRTPTLCGTLIKRYRRSLADVRLENGTTVTAHCPNPTAMRGCSTPGNAVILSDSGNPSRRHPLTWELIQVGETWVCINITMARKVVNDALERRAIPTFTQYQEIDRDVTYGLGKKVDLILHGMERNCFVNIYPVTWAENDVALYPDYVSDRVTNSILSLAEITKRGHSALAFFFVQRADCTSFRPAEQVDRAFLKAMLTIESAGVEILVYRAGITPEDISLGTQLPYSLS